MRECLSRVLFVVVIGLVVQGCKLGLPPDLYEEPPTATQTRHAPTQEPSTSTSAPTPRPPTATPVPATSTSKPTATVTNTVKPTATFTPVPPTATPSPTAPVIDVLPTFTPIPDAGQIRLGDLPIGQPGHYVNPTFGYWVQYPEAWYTRFGNRPLLASFSNLDPGAHNRNSMRAEGCLIDINASVNVYAFTLEELRAQMVRSFSGAKYFDMDGEPALLVPRTVQDNPFESEWVYVKHDDHWYLLTAEYSRSAREVCQPAWENMLMSWRWFTPQLAIYRNTNYGYAIAYPQSWYRFNPNEQGISLSNEDPTGVVVWTDFLNRAVVVTINVHENSERWSLKEWVAAQEWDVDLMTEVPLDATIGIRVQGKGTTDGTQETNAYFQGPLGRIYEVICSYPIDRQWEFRPIINALIFSFSF